MNDNTYLGRPLIENVPTLEGTRYTNPDADSPLVAEFRRAQQEREQHLRPLRIDSRTTILVRAGKCNEAYAAAYRKQASGEQPRGEQTAAEKEHPRRRGGRADRIRREYDGGKCVRKECTRCHRMLPLDAFHRERACKDGVSNVCKDCRNRTSQAYRKQKKQRRGGSIVHAGNNEHQTNE